MKRVIAFVVGLIFFVGCGKSYTTTTIEPVASEQLTMYKTNETYGDSIVDCVSFSPLFQKCSLDKLPLILMDTPNPTKEDILKRVVVSDKWMGDNFATMLDYLPADIKKLFGAVTAIVISRDIIPSYYNSATGAIYLDPRYFWLTPEEASDIIPKTDYRSGYGNSLQFLPAWRYIKDNKEAIKRYSLDSNITRTPEDLKYALARLLYHELAHANDFSSNIDKVDKTIPIGEALKKTLDESLSAKLDEKYPLKSQDLKDLAGVLFRGESSNASLDALSAEDVGSKFEGDGATDLYGFNNRYEDFAMLFEESMMRYNFKLERDVAFVKKDNSYTVGWGQRNRVASDSVKNRAKFVTKSLIPEVDWDKFFAGDVGTTKKLKNVGWYDSVSLDGVPRRLKRVDKNIVEMDFLSPEY